MYDGPVRMAVGIGPGAWVRGPVAPVATLLVPTFSVVADHAVPAVAEVPWFLVGLVRVVGVGKDVGTGETLDIREIGRAHV
mgnify:CR=1 FL=1